jgi:hypothetical protein
VLPNHPPCLPSPQPVCHLPSHPAPPRSLASVTNPGFQVHSSSLAILALHQLGSITLPSTRANADRTLSCPVLSWWSATVAQALMCFISLTLQKKIRGNSFAQYPTGDGCWTLRTQLPAGLCCTVQEPMAAGLIRPQGTCLIPLHSCDSVTSCAPSTHPSQSRPRPSCQERWCCSCNCWFVSLDHPL